MRLFVFISIILCPLLASGQSYFNNAYDINNGTGFTSTVIEYDSGYYYVSGNALDTTPSINITKLYYDGTINFCSRYYYPNHVFNLGFSHSLSVMADGNILFCGLINDTNNNDDCFLMKFDKLGDTVWTARIGGSGFDAGVAVFSLPDTSCFLICNTTSFGNGGADFWRLRIDKFGDIEDSDFYGTNGYEVVYNGDKTSDGGMIMSGMMNSHPYIVKTDSVGGEEWNKAYLNYDDYCFITQLPTGGYIIATRKMTATDGIQACLIKTDTAGNIIWQRLYGTLEDEYSYSKPIILNDGSIVLGGEFDSISGVDGGFVLKTDSLGNQKWLRYYTLSTIVNNLYDIKPTSDGGFILAGATYITTQDPWIVKIDSMGCEVVGCDGVGFIEVPNDLSLKLFPNPSIDGSVTVTWPSSLDALTLTLFDATGKRIRSEKLSANQSSIQLAENLSAGLYLVRLEYSDGVLTEKFLVR